MPISHFTRIVRNYENLAKLGNQIIKHKTKLKQIEKQKHKTQNKVEDMITTRLNYMQPSTSTSTSKPKNVNVNVNDIELIMNKEHEKQYKRINKFQNDAKNANKYLKKHPNAINEFWTGI